MTRLASTEVTCRCGNIFKIVYYASINLFMGGAELVDELLAGRLYNFKCTACGDVFRLNTKIIIATCSKMITISTGDDLETIKETLKKMAFWIKTGRL